MFCPVSVFSKCENVLQFTEQDRGRLAEVQPVDADDDFSSGRDGTHFFVL